jgi:hypothetical protein
MERQTQSNWGGKAAYFQTKANNLRRQINELELRMPGLREQAKAFPKNASLIQAVERRENQIRQLQADMNRALFHAGRIK